MKKVIITVTAGFMTASCSLSQAIPMQKRMMFVGYNQTGVVSTAPDSVRCPDSINTNIDHYQTIPASVNDLYEGTLGGGLTPGDHKLSKVSVYVAKTPGFVGFIACQYGKFTDKLNYVIYQNTKNTVQYYPKLGSWSKSSDGIGYGAVCTGPLDECTLTTSKPSINKKRMRRYLG